MPQDLGMRGGRRQICLEDAGDEVVDYQGGERQHLQLEPPNRAWPAFTPRGCTPQPSANRRMAISTIGVRACPPTLQDLATYPKRRYDLPLRVGRDGTSLTTRANLYRSPTYRGGGTNTFSYERHRRAVGQDRPPTARSQPNRPYFRWGYKYEQPQGRPTATDTMFITCGVHAGVVALRPGRAPTPPRPPSFASRRRGSFQRSPRFEKSSGSRFAGGRLRLSTLHNRRDYRTFANRPGLRFNPTTTADRVRPSASR